MKKKTMRRSLLMSALAMVMCLSMLIGSTFAWFTDSVTNGVNKIESGNLDIELYHTDYSKPHEPVEADTALFTNVDGDPILWEPGAEAVEDFLIKNAGTLALKYQLKVTFNNATATPEGKTLADALDIAQIAFSGNYTDPTYLPYDSVLVEGGLVEGYLLPGEEIRFATYISWEPSDNDNDFNVPGGLKADLGVSLVATQYTYEKDILGDQYDAGAEYPVFYTADSAAALGEALDAAKAGDTINLVPGVAYGTTTIDSALTGVTIVGAEDTNAFFEITSGAVLNNVTFKDLDVSGYNGNGSYNGAVNIRAGADVDITFEGCDFAPNSGYAGVRVFEPTAELSFVDCTFTGGRYGVYDSGSPIAKAEFIGCDFAGQSSWAIQFNGGDTDSVITIDDCTFDALNGGIIKVLGAPAADSTFTFTDNTITNSRGHDGKEAEWFWISSAYAITCSGNTLDGADWTPAAAQGLGK